MLNGVSDFPTYCAPHLGQSIRYITLLLLQLRLCLMLKVFFVILLENVFVLLICLQHWQSLLRRHGLHSPGFPVGLTTLLFEILLLPIRSRKFLHRRYAKTGLSLNFSAIFGSNRRICQCLLIIGPKRGSVLLYVTTRGILLDGFFFLFSSRSFRDQRDTLLELCLLGSLFG